MRRISAQPVQVLVHPAHPSVLVRSRTEKWIRCTSSSSISTTTGRRARRRSRPAACPDEVDALEHHRPALVQCALDRRLDADADVPCLVDEAGDRRVAVTSSSTAAPASKLEWWIVGMNSAREEGAHRLADEVGRRDARDPEPVRDLGRDGRLAGAGGAADSSDDRHVERLQRRRAGAAGRRPAAPRSRRASPRPSSSSRSSSTCAARRSRQVELDAASRARRRGSSGDAGRDRAPAPSGPSSTGARRLAERQRVAVAALRHAGDPLGREREQRLVEPRRDDVVRGEDDAAARARAHARRRRRSRPPFSSTRYVSASTARELARERGAVGEVRRDVARRRASRCADVGRAGGEDGDPALERRERPQRGASAADRALAPRSRPRRRGRRSSRR